MNKLDKELSGKEEKLRIAHQQWQTTFDAVNDAIWLLDENGIILISNKATASLLNINSSEIVGRHCWEVIHKTSKPIPKCPLHRMRKTLQRETIEFTIGARWFEIIVDPIIEEGRKIKGAVHILSDITERKQAEEALRASNELLSLYIQHSPIYTFIKEVTPTQSVTLCASDNYRQMIGIPASEMIGKTMAELFPPEFAAKITADDWAVVSQGDILSLDEELNGRSYTTIKFPIVQGEKTLLAGYTIDITERKQAEEALRKQEEQYRSIVENAKEGIYRRYRGRYITVNKAYADMLDYESPEEVITTIIDTSRQLFVDPEVSERLRNISEQQGYVKDFEAEVFKKDGSTIWVAINSQAVKDDKGQLFYYQGFFEDITARKRMETERDNVVERLRKALGITIQTLVSVVEIRDPYTAGHQRRVADLARSIATEMGLTKDHIEIIRMASMIHDIGKISVPAEILNKPTALTNLEFDIIKAHVQFGYDILKGIDSSLPIARMVYEHHERMDGSGYPNGATGGTLLIESKILAVADVIEAISSNRPYRPGYGADMALEEIIKNRGTLYDPNVVDSCLILFKDKGYTLKSATHSAADNFADLSPTFIS